MLEPLNTANLQRLTAELTQGRVETLLRIGQVQVATVVDVVPQPPRQNSAQPQNTTSQVRQTVDPQASTTDNRQTVNNLTYNRPAPSAANNSAATNTQGAVTATPSATTKGQPVATSQAPVPAAQTNQSTAGSNATGTQPAAQNTAAQTSASEQVYRARVNIEGKLLEIVTPVPLKPGSQITLSRDNNNRLIISTPATAQSAASITSTAGTSTQSAATRLPMLQLGETAVAKVQQSRIETPPPGNTATVSRESTSTQQPPTPTSSNRTASAETQHPPAASYRTTILVKGTPVDIATPRPIPPGTEVKITLDNKGQVQVQLPAPARFAADQALREHLPVQQPLNQLLNLLTDPATSQQLARSQPLLQGLLQLLMGRSLSSPQQSDPAQLRQQLLDSGTQLENKLARQDSSALKQDSKALLLQLQQRLSNPGQGNQVPASTSQRITEMTQQAISRVLVNQLSSLTQQSQEAEGDRTRTLVADIPIQWQQRTENLQLKITQRQGSGNEQADPQRTKWQVQLNFSMENMPPMRADLSLLADDISVLFYGDRETKTLVEPQLNKLRNALEGVGLQVDILQVRDQPPSEKANVRSHSPLVDVRT